MIERLNNSNSSSSLWQDLFLDLIGATFIKAKKFPSFVPFVSAAAIDIAGAFLASEA